MADHLNDNDYSAMSEPDAYGQAAYLLVESLIHSLVALSVLPLETAIEVVDIACDVKVEIVADASDPPMTTPSAVDILQGLAGSLRATQPV